MMDVRCVLTSLTPVARAVAAKLAFCTVLARALSAGAETIRIEDAPFPMPPIVVAEFPSRDFRIDDYGAKQDGSKCTDAFTRAFAACEQAGGGRVVVPRGEWLTGAVRFRSNCNLFLEDGAVLAFTDDPTDYPRVETTWEGVECLAHSPLLYAYACTNVAITGRGLVAPRMDLWKKWFGRPPAHQYATECLYHWCSTNAPLAARDVMAIPGSNVRPHLIQFNRCQNVLLDGFRIRESPFWMIHLYHSENCIVRNLETYAHGSNNDGVDVDMTRNVLIENCKFDQGDDGICLKAGRNADAWRLGRPTENVVIRNCDLVKSHSLMGIGSELSGGIRNIWMTRCKVQTTGGLLRIKTNRRRGGFVENVWIDHCQCGVARWVLGIDTDVLFQWRNFPDYEIRQTRIRNLFMDEIDCEQAVNGFELLGDSRLPPENIEVKNVRIGRVTKAFKTVKNCRNVRFENVAEPKADPSFPWPYLEHFSNADRIAKKSPLYAKAVRFALRKDLAMLADGSYDLGDGVVAKMGRMEFKPYQAAVYKTDIDHDTIVVLPDELSVERFLVGKYGTEFATWDQYIAVFPAGVTVASGLAVGHARKCRRLTISVPALWKVKSPCRPVPEAPFEMPVLKECVFPQRDFPITDYGANTDGVKCTDAFVRAFSACEQAGGGRVVVPGGEWVTGAVRFRSNCELHLGAGAKLVFTDDPEDYPEVFTSWEGTECYNHSPLIYAYGCTNVAITGTGLIEPRMRRWSEEWAGYDAKQLAATKQLYFWGATNAVLKARRMMALDSARARPHLIQFNRCQNVLLDGFRINGSPFWLIHLYHSENCIVRNLSTYARGLNSDGLDIEMTRNVLVENCRFDQGDDGIVLKAGRNADAWRIDRPTENVVIRNCDMASSHSLLGIGSELSGGIRNVWVKDCKVEMAFSLLKIKTGRRRGGFVHNVFVEDCTADDVGSVFNLTTVYMAQYSQFPDFEIRYTDIAGIHLKNVSCNRAKTGVSLHGDVHRPARGIEMDNVRIGEATERLVCIENCQDVRMDGLVLSSPDRSRRRIAEIELAKEDSLDCLPPSYAKAIGFLKRRDLASLPVGRHAIDGDDVVAEISDVTTTPFSQTEKHEVLDKDHDILYFIVDGEENMFEVGESFSFRWVGPSVVLAVPAGMVHSPHHTNKGPKRLRVCAIKIRVADSWNDSTRKALSS